MKSFKDFLKESEIKTYLTNLTKDEIQELGSKIYQMYYEKSNGLKFTAETIEYMINDLSEFELEIYNYILSYIENKGKLKNENI